MIKGFLKPLSVVMVQLTSVDDFVINKKVIFDSLKKISSLGGTRLIIFPENSLFMRLNNNAKISGLSLEDEIFNDLKSYCIDQACDILITTAIKENSQFLVNGTVWINLEGRILVAYKKIHLFDVDVVGLNPIRESLDFIAGSEPSIIEIDHWKVGLSICYDLRFPALYQFYAEREVDLILVPSAFLVPTGKAHWEVLLRARAIECQCYVAAPAQGGNHKNDLKEQRSTWGHSMIVDPWGEVIVDVIEKDQTDKWTIVQNTLDPMRIQYVRRQIPMRRQFFSQGN